MYSFLNIYGQKTKTKTKTPKLIEVCSLSERIIMIMTAPSLCYRPICVLQKNLAQEILSWCLNSASRYFCTSDERLDFPLSPPALVGLCRRIKSLTKTRQHPTQENVFNFHRFHKHFLAFEFPICIPWMGGWIADQLQVGLPVNTKFSSFCNICFFNFNH